MQVPKRRLLSEIRREAGNHDRCGWDDPLLNSGRGRSSEPDRPDASFPRELLRDPYWPLRAAHQLEQSISWPVQYLRAAPKGAQARVPVNLKNLESCSKNNTRFGNTDFAILNSNYPLILREVKGKTEAEIDDIIAHTPS